jgi:hypothetical protein
VRALHVVAATYSQRPSAILGIEDERLAYDFDLAVLSAALSKDEPTAKHAKDDASEWGDWKALAARRAM